MSEAVVHTIAGLRASGRARDAVAYFGDHSSQLDENSRLPALIQVLYAAIDAGMAAEARHFAESIVAIDPDVPSAKKYLAGN